jgi:hypothetical protein
VPLLASSSRALNTSSDGTNHASTEWATWTVCGQIPAQDSQRKEKRARAEVPEPKEELKMVLCVNDDLKMVRGPAAVVANVAWHYRMPGNVTGRGSSHL